ncbi:HesA/MoeB/ThiF family protein [Marinospirillum perlucidum]|uniref:HesA/MoeB/ThiF family protein n=1 Tax=Marinospirillum perlucidum TaxID=1982602 RepID=UPI000DF1E508|nr:molybdopterin-synthase adenylyltransferase MoeB [Marinospirillum perlucidum]
MTHPDLTDQQLLRYSRQLLLPELDVAGQQKLLASRVLILGLGGLGSPVALYLAAAGVGELHLADDDEVELSNLQRQLLHQEASVGKTKLASAKETLKATNPEIDLVGYSQRLEGELLDRAVQQVDLVCDCSDNFATRFALNRSCYRWKKPLISGAAIGFSGQLAVFDPHDPHSPCYACLYDEDAEEEALSCSEAGVLAPLVGVIGSLQAMEALKLLAQCRETATGKLLTYEGLKGNLRTRKLVKDPACRCCANI